MSWQGQFNQRVSPRGVTAEAQEYCTPKVIMKNQLTINPLDLSKEIRQKLITVRGELVLVDRDVAARSGGQRTKVLLAKLLLEKPKVLLCSIRP